MLIRRYLLNNEFTAQPLDSCTLKQGRDYGVQGKCDYYVCREGDQLVTVGVLPRDMVVQRFVSDLMSHGMTLELDRASGSLSDGTCSMRAEDDLVELLSASKELYVFLNAKPREAYDGCHLSYTPAILTFSQREPTNDYYSRSSRSLDLVIRSEKAGSAASGR